MKELKVTITGIRPMIMHNGLLADPTNPYVRQIKEICKKGSKKMTDADYAKRDWLEWRGSAYWEDDMGFYLPSDNIERCVQEGAKKSRLGKDFAAAVLMRETEAVIDHRLRGKKVEKIYEDPGYTIRKGVKVQQSRIIRVRPMIPTGWKCTFALDYDDTIVNKDDIIKALNDAGSLVGQGDFRPKFGRFTVEVHNA